MKWLKQYLKHRRENDVVKILTVLFVICAFCIGSSVISGINFYIKNNKQVEYSFEGPIVTDELLNEIKENKNIKDATALKTVPIEFLINGEIVNLECQMISKEYLKNVMGIDNFQSNLFYVNKQAMKIIFENKSQSVVKFMFQSEAEETSYKNGQIVSLLDNGEEESDMPVVYYCASSSELKDAAEAIILLEKHDLDGSIIQYLSIKGFQLKEREAVVMQNAEMNEMYLVIKYRVIICAICLFSGFVLKKYALPNS